MKRRRITRRLLFSGAGLAAGLAVGIAAVAVTATAGLLDISSSSRTGQAAPSRLAATHLPPLLPLSGEPVDLRYDLYCDHGDDAADTPCDGGGTVFVRAGTSAFQAIPLQVDASADEGRYVARVPADLTSASTGFQYYAVLRDNSTGQTTTVPEGGAAAPQWSHPLSRPVTVDLGRHSFSVSRSSAGTRVASATWGSGSGDVGLEAGKQETPIGGSSFDVDSNGTVTLLDEVNRRALRFTSRSQSAAIPLDVSGREADMSVEPGGGIDVLETQGAGQPDPILKRFSSSGQVASTVTLADPFASSVRVVQGQPVVLEYPSSQWIPVLAGGGGAGARASVRTSAGLAGPSGAEAVVFKTDGEVRVALVSNGVVQRSWRVLSSTPLAEVQLAQPLGDGVALVVRVYTDSDDEFEVLVLRDRGLVRRFSVASADWAETAPLARFRLVGSSLYQLGSTSTGPFVDRYDLGVS